ncbi:MAG: hypothetical protein AAFV53_23740 [Myxococcota bacterium]
MRQSLLAIFFPVLMSSFGCDAASEDPRGTNAQPGQATELTPLDGDGEVDIDCQIGPAFPDYWAGAIDDPDLITYDNYDESFDAGISDVLIAIADGDGAFPLQVTDAIVSNFTEREQRIELLWLVDASGGLLIDAGVLALSAEDVRPGDAVTLTVLEGELDFNTPTVTDVIDFTINSTGNAVYVVDGASVDVTVGEHLNTNIRASGELIASEGSCGGGFSCYTFRFGPGSPATLRVRDGFGFDVGDCIDLLAPLGQFGGTGQFNIDNNNWVSTY